MEKILIDNYDNIAKMEDIIEHLIANFNLTGGILKMKRDNELYAITIMSILQKEQYYEEYIGRFITETVDTRKTEKLKEIVSEIKHSLEMNNEPAITIYKYSEDISKYLENYFNRKNENYILEKYTLEAINKIKKAKEYIKNNPFALNQMLYYEENQLTDEEKIIAELREVYIQAAYNEKNSNRMRNNPFQSIEDYEDLEDEEEKQVKIIASMKNTMKSIYSKEKLNEITRFVISNTYQEISDDLKNPKRNIIIPIIENEKINVEDIVNHFIENERFSRLFLEDFIDYNRNIDQGRLEELKHKKSNQYAKRIYKKPL